jgi:hypothetical protein
LIDSIEEEVQCHGLREINALDDCVNYFARTMPYELTDAFNVYAGINIADTATIDDTFNLEIPNSYYKVSVSSNNTRVYLYGLVCPSKITKQSLEFYPVLFPNIYANGEICFGNDYCNDTNSMASKGKFSHIIESFWSSEFNHDLADIGFNLLDGDLYSEEYHESLRDELSYIYNSKDTDEDNSETDHLNLRTITTSNISDWEWYDTTNYSFYILCTPKSKIVLIINEVEQIIHKSIRLKR